jgi:branched-chain amino acid transport system substrate-binding protein
MLCRIFFFLLPLVTAATVGKAEDAVRIGLILTYSGPFADNARQIDDAVTLYVKQHGNVVAGKRIEIIRRDTGGPAPEIAKRLALELVTRDKVHFLAGFVLTPNALAAAEVSAQTKTPMIVMDAAGSTIPAKSPYVVRVSFTLPQLTVPLAQWAIREGMRTSYTIVSDYGPGQDAEHSFQNVFEQLGGRIIGGVRTPLRNPDFLPYVQRARDAAPNAVFVFLPGGEQPVSIMRSFVERGFKESGIQILGSGEITEDRVLESVGAGAFGVITSSHYSHEHDSALNHEFVDGFRGITGGRFPNYLAVGGYDGMGVLYEVIRRLDGAIDPDRAMQVMKGLSVESPRGPLEIDPGSRDVIQTVYIRRVERHDNLLHNVEIGSISRVSASGQSQ